MSNIVIQGFPSSGSYTLNDIRGYKVYTALLSQSADDSPTAIVLENTIGNIVWTYDSDGRYIGTLAGAFPCDKTWANSAIYRAAYTGNLSSMYMDLNEAPPDYIVLFTMEVNTENYSNNLLQHTPIEIRVYP